MPVPVVWTRGRPEHQGAFRLGFSRARTGVMVTRCRGGRRLSSSVNDIIPTRSASGICHASAGSATHDPEFLDQL